MTPKVKCEYKRLKENIELIEYGSLKSSHLRAKEWTEYKLKVQKGKIGLFKCFQYIDKIDIILMLTGTCCSIFGGCCFSILSIIFGLMTNSLLTHTVEQIFVQNGNTTVNSETSSINMEQFAGMMSFYSNSFFFLALCILISSSMQTFFWEMVAERQVYKLRQILFKQILRQDIGWYDKNDNGNLALKLSDDLERIKEGIGVKMSLVIQCLSLFFSGIATGLMTNWRLTCIILLIGPIMMGMNAYVIKFNANAAAREQKQYGIAGNIANEVLMNIRTVIAFCKEAAEMKRYKKALEAGAKITRSSDLILSYAMGFVYFLICICFGIGFYFGALFMNEGLCTPGSVFTVFFCVISGAFSAGNALPFIHAIAVASGCATSIFDIINRVPDVDPYSKSGLKPVSVNGAIEIKNVSFKYPTRPEVEVLHNLSVTIEQGKIIAFVGSSGAGKSTLIGLLLRFYDPSEGMITLDGIPLQQLNLRWLRNQIGVVAQEPILFSSSIAENIRYGRVDVSQKEIEKAAHLANAHSFISKLPEGYNTLAGIRGSQLSGGQKQRIAIARALVRNPKILLLDEATSALDGHSEEVVQQALEKAMQNRTTIIIAHRMSTVRNADIIYVMKNGYIAENGKHEDLMARKDLYYNFVMAQTLVKNIDEGRNLDSDEYMETKVKPFIREQSISPSVYSEKKCEVQDIPQEIMPKVTIYQLLKMNSKEWSKFIIGIVNGVFCGVMMPIFTVLYSEIFKIFSLPHEQMMPTAVSWAILFPIFGIIYGLSMFTQSYVLSNASTKLIVRLRSKAFNNIIKQSVSWFDLPFSSPNLLITRLARDAPLVKMVAGVRMCHLINANVTIIAGVAISIYFSWRLGLVLACVVPCIIITTFNKQRMTKKLLSRDDKLMENASQIAHECIQNIRTVQALGNEEVFVEQYMESLNLPYKESKKQAFVFGISYGASQAMLYTMYGIGFKYGFYLYQTGNITIINMYKSFFATTFCAGSSGQSLTYLSDYTRAKSAICRMIYLSKLKSKTEPLDHNKIYPIIHGQIEFKNVNFTYPVRTEVNVLKELDFNLEIGKTLAIVGESGSGKSTIISLMERFYDPTSGIIKVDNYNIAELNTCYLRRNIGLVTQEPCLFDRTIKENISYGLLTEEDESVIMQKVIVAAKSVNIHNFIVSLPLGYETMVGEGGTNLSGGQKQRIAIARALVKDPKILLLDEATSALDTENEKIVQEALDIARTNRTCITIAHRLSTIQNADKIAVMSKGKIVESGTHTELINKQNYYYRLTRKQDI